MEVDLATHPLAKEQLMKRMPPEKAAPPGKLDTSQISRKGHIKLISHFNMLNN